MNIQKIKELYQQSKGMKIQIEKELESNKSHLDEMNLRMKRLEDAQTFLQKVAQETQEHLKFKIEDIVNLALETCFPGEYSFRLNFNISRGKTEAELVFLSQSSDRPIDPMNASGGGVVDIACFALRIASYVLEQGIDNVIVLDEPMKFVSKDLLDSAGEILKVLSTKLGLQIIMVTHENKFIDIADKVFEVKKDEKGRSKIKNYVS